MIEELMIRNRRGLNLAACFHQPEVSNYPVVIALHGFSGYKEEQHLIDICEGLEVANIGAIRFDASGWGESEGTVDEDFRFSHYLDDVDDVIEWLRKERDITAFGLWGHSMGGQLAVTYAGMHPEIKAVCAVSAPISLKDSKGIVDRYADWRDKGYREMTTSRYGTVRFPYAVLEDRAQYSTLENASKITAPFMVVWGDNDTLVDGSETEQIYEAAPEPKEKLFVPGMGHFYKKEPEQREVVKERVVAFFSDVLK